MNEKQLILIFVLENLFNWSQFSNIEPNTSLIMCASGRKPKYL